MAEFAYPLNIQLVCTPVQVQLNTCQVKIEPPLMERYSSPKTFSFRRLLDKEDKDTYLQQVSNALHPLTRFLS